MFPPYPFGVDSGSPRKLVGKKLTLKKLMTVLQFAHLGIIFRHFWGLGKGGILFGGSPLTPSGPTLAQPESGLGKNRPSKNERQYCSLALFRGFFRHFWGPLWQCLPEAAQRRAQGVPKASQRRPQGVPKASQGVPKASQRRPKASQGVPRRPQGIPKASHGVPKASRRRPKASPRRPKGVPRRSRGALR